MDSVNFFEKNIGGTDRIVRIGIGVILLNAYALSYFVDPAGYLAMALSVFFMFTGVSGWSPEYAMSGFSTLSGTRKK